MISHSRQYEFNCLQPDTFIAVGAQKPSYNMLRHIIIYQTGGKEYEFGQPHWNTCQ